MAKRHPHIIIIAGPNGEGKSTTAPSLLQGTLGVKEFVIADVIAQGLSVFQPETAAFHAGRIMLERLHYLAGKKECQHPICNMLSTAQSTAFRF